jgi:protein phosphatase
MSPPETSKQADWLEYPTEAFSYYRSQGAPRVMCEEKHMGSRAVLVLCRDSSAASRRFGVSADSAPGACYTRTGRRFLNDERLERAFVERLSNALSVDGFWERHDTDWVCLDAEIMPWNAKAQGLLREQYAPVGSAGQMALGAALSIAQKGAARGLDLGSLMTRLERGERNISRYIESYGRYCWDVHGLDDLRVAPFHLLATEGHVHTDRTHQWHMEELARLAEVDPLFVATRRREVNTLDRDDCAQAELWWEELTASGAEGMVVKPMEFMARGSRGLAQPALKCRGREYLRIIYGPDYDEPANIERLRKRGLATKRSLAVREFALGIEALERFTRREPLWRTHQAVFGVLAMESEPVDPRL